MAYCTNCGQQVADGAKFCANCGTPISQNTSNTERKTVFDGEIHKCPHCGEVLKAFETVCPTCKFELRGTKGSSAVKDLAEKLENASSEQQRILIIKNFPIPNTKEDIFEFLLLASSNFDASYYAQHLNEEDASDAWLIKIEQCYQKASIAITSVDDLAKIRSLYEEVIRRIEKEKTLRERLSRKETLKNISLFAPNILITAGWILSLIILVVLSAVNTDAVGFNAFQLLAIIDLVAGCFLVPKMANCATAIPKAIASVGLVVSIIILILLSTINLDSVGFNACQLLLILDIVATVIICGRLLKKK